MTVTAQPNPSAQVSSPQFEELLLRADRAQVIASLARGMAHDLRGPLQTLTLLVDPNADLLGGPEGARLRQAVSESVQHLADTIGTFSQVYAPVEADAAPVIVEDLLASVVDLQRYQRGLPAVETQLELPGGLPPVRGHEAQLRHLLLSLISNAKQAMAELAQPELRLLAASESGMVRMVVEDIGPGLPAAVAADPFRPFGHGVGGRLGIGLAVARCLAVRHGGSLELAPGPAGGTRAILRIPTWRRGG